MEATAGPARRKTAEENWPELRRGGLPEGPGWGLGAAGDLASWEAQPPGDSGSGLAQGSGQPARLVLVPGVLEPWGCGHRPEGFQETG